MHLVPVLFTFNIQCALKFNKIIPAPKAEKILKYKDLTMEIRRTWNVKAKTDTGNNKGITKPFRQHLSNRPGKHKINVLQENSLLCTSRILRIVLM